MGDIIFVIIFFAIMASVISKTKKAYTGQSDDDSPNMPGRVFERMVRGDTTQANRTVTTYESGEGKSTYTVQTIKTAQPTVHTANGEDCEAHKMPETSQGSFTRAHSYNSHGLDDDCDAHKVQESSEGESLEHRLERFRKKKAEIEAAKRVNSRYDEPAPANADVKADLEDGASVNLSLDRDSLVQAFLMSEILGAPRSKNK